MGIYYIKTRDGSIYELDATTSMEQKSSGEATEHVVESGASVSDHYVNKNERISFQGVISDIKSSYMEADRAKSTDQFISGLKAVKSRREPFSVIWREDKGTKGGATYLLSNCFFESLTFMQDKTNGYGYGNHSYKVSMDIKQVRFGTRARLTTEKSDLIVDKSQIKSTATGSPTVVDYDTTKTDKTLNIAIPIPGYLSGSGGTGVKMKDIWPVKQE